MSDRLNETLKTTYKNFLEFAKKNDVKLPEMIETGRVDVFEFTQVLHQLAGPYEHLIDIRLEMIDDAVFLAAVKADAADFKDMFAWTPAEFDVYNKRISPDQLPNLRRLYNFLKFFFETGRLFIAHQKTATTSR